MRGQKGKKKNRALLVNSLLLCALPILASSLLCGPTPPSDDGAGWPTPVILPTLLRAVALNNTGVLLTFSDEMEDATTSAGPNQFQTGPDCFSDDHLSYNIEVIGN